METATPQLLEPAAPSIKHNEKALRILIIRSASRTFSKAVESLKKEFPKGSITVLTANPDQSQANLDIDETMPLPFNRRISIFSYGLNARRQLRQRQFDLVAVLYNIEGGWGYSNVEWLALSTNAKKIRGYFPDGTYRDLSAGTIFKHYLKERTAIGWVALNIVTAVFQMILFGLAMTVETLWRRVVPGSPKNKQSTSTTKQS